MNKKVLPSFYERSNSGYAIKPKKTVKRQTDTKTQWNRMHLYFGVACRRGEQIILTKKVVLELLWFA